MSPTPHASLRWRIVIGSTVAACFATIYWWFPDREGDGLITLGAIFVVSNIALPSATWVRLSGMTRRAVPAIVREPRGPRPSGRVRARLRQWHERLYFHLSRAEWDSRVQIGMSLWHTERLAYHLPNPEEWDEREVQPDLWPDGEWTGVIEEVRREEGWKP